MTFQVQKAACSTCIYRKDSPLDLEKLEGEIADAYGGFNGYRERHHAAPGSGVCCRGFWNRHKDRFAAGQVKGDSHQIWRTQREQGGRKRDGRGQKAGRRGQKAGRVRY